MWLATGPEGGRGALQARDGFHRLHGRRHGAGDGAGAFLKADDTRGALLRAKGASTPGEGVQPSSKQGAARFFFSAPGLPIYLHDFVKKGGRGASQHSFLPPKAHPPFPRC